MLTRSQAKIGQADDETSQVVKQKSGRSVRLSDDLLYIVNKKLRTMDQAERDRKIHNFGRYSLNSSIPDPFTEITYRKQFAEFSQTKLAVMHKINFDSNSTAVCKLNSMSQFLVSIFGRREHYYPPVYWQLNIVAARFIQLPKDYFRPHSDCHFFGELAWKENGIMMVDADNFALCLIIWRLKEWLVNPIENEYPLFPCKLGGEGGISCPCHSLLDAMRTDDRLRKFLEGRTIFEGIDYDLWEESISEDQRNQDWEENNNVLELIRREMKIFYKKLITGEEMVSQSNRAENVLSALQMDKLIDRFKNITHCFRRKMFGCEYDW